MSGAEGVHHEDVEILGPISCKGGIVGLFAGFVASILNKEDFAVV